MTAAADTSIKISDILAAVDAGMIDNHLTELKAHIEKREISLGKQGDTLKRERVENFAHVSDEARVLPKRRRVIIESDAE